MKENYLLLWSIQSKSQTFPVRADPNFSMFPDSYKWMSQQMINKVGPPPTGVTLPVWCYYIWNGVNKAVDLNRQGHGEKGIELIRYTLRVPKDQVLLSDFESWSAFLSLGDAYDPLRIFDIEDREYGDGRYVQACIWEIHPEWVVRTKEFIAV